jgi:hypothetical protein
MQIQMRHLAQTSRLHNHASIVMECLIYLVPAAREMISTTGLWKLIQIQMRHLAQTSRLHNHAAIVMECLIYLAPVAGEMIVRLLC